MDKNMEDVDQRAAWLQVEKSSAAGHDIFGEPQNAARIGDEYQAQIPFLLKENEHQQLICLPSCHDANSIDVQNDFALFGRPIPVTFVDKQHKNKEEMQVNIQESATDNGLLLVPDSSCESWSKLDHDSFILGLYMFGKDFVLVNKFMGNKGMSNVVSYYYRRFCRSSEHQKWSTYFRKKKRTKSILGKKIFEGWRQEEFFSRLLPNVTDESKAHLTQVTNLFEEGTLPLEKYIFALRDAVGINLFITVVAIGKGKQDLIASKPNKQLKKIKNRHSTYSSLKTEEVVDLLKDRIGLSKTSLNNFFWEAVWPRLLARGWRYEGSRNFAFQKSKQHLVFLVPGVLKFSRRGLVKGIQYFESFNEVLRKVACEPQLLESEPEQDRSNAKQRSDDKEELMTYTSVDTSLDGDVKVREKTMFPVLKSDAKKEHNSIENTRNDNMRGEGEAMEDSCALSKKKHSSKVIDLKYPRVAAVSYGDNTLRSAKQPVVVPETTTNQAELSSPSALETFVLDRLMIPRKKRTGLVDETLRRH